MTLEEFERIKEKLEKGNLSAGSELKYQILIKQAQLHLPKTQAQPS